MVSVIQGFVVEKNKDLSVDQVHQFLRVYFLYWLEALSWIGKTSEGILAILSLAAQIQADKAPNLYAFVYDTKRFSLHNRLVIEQTPLQLYCSALVFAPEKSIVRRQFEEYIPAWIQMKPTIEANWKAALQTLEGHTSYVNSAAFSPDGKQVVSGSYDRTVRLWDAATGAALQTLEGRYTGSVSSMAFSPDGKLLPILQVSNYWIMEDNADIFWLPPDYRETRSVTWNRSLIIGYSSRRISFFYFKKGAKLII